MRSDICHEMREGIHKLVASESKNPEAASKADKKGRTPLLLAYKSYVYESHIAWDIANDMLAEVAVMLAEAAPLVTTNEDYRDMTALEYGLEKEHRTSTLETLQVAVSDYHRNLYNNKLEDEKLGFLPMSRPQDRRKYTAIAA